MTMSLPGDAPTPIRLHLFGPLDLRRADRCEIRSILAQPKRMALLARLAGEPGLFHRRDALVAVLWSEMDEPRARRALTRSLHFLRQSLGEGVIVTRGDEEVAVDADALWSDVGAFRAAVSAERWDDALRLATRGEFLSGFHLDDTVEFERWVDGERLALRRDLARAAAAGVRSALAEEDLEAALDRARLASESEPFSESALRVLLEVLDGAGDRSGAVAAFEAFAERLRAELGVDPGPETVALVDRIRSRVEPREHAGRRDAGERVQHHGPAPVSVAPSPRSAPTPHPTVRARSFPSPIPLVAAGAALALVAAAAAAWPRGDAGPAWSEDRILVVPFDNDSGESALDWLGELAADRIAVELQKWGGAVVLESALAGASGSSLGAARVGNRRSALDQGRRAGATTVLWGRIHRQGDGLVIEARLSAVRDGRVLHAFVPVAAPEASPQSVVDRLSERVAGALAAERDPRVASQLGPDPAYPTLPAYRAFVQGVELFVDDRPTEALPFFEAAFESDTTFHLALLWQVYSSGERGRLAPLKARRTSLAALDRHALDYFDAKGRNDSGGTFRAAAAAAALAPGSTWSHNAAQQARHLNRPGEAVRLASQVRPEEGWAAGWYFYWTNLVRSLHLLGRHDEELDAARRWRRLRPRDLDAAAAELMALAALGRTDDVDALADEILRMDPQPSVGLPGYWVDLAWREAVSHGRDVADLGLVERALAWYEAPIASAWIRVFPPADTAWARLNHRDHHARIRYDSGDLEGARREFEALVADGVDYYETRGYLGRIAARMGDRAGAEAAIRAIEGGPLPNNRFGKIQRAAILTLLGDEDAAMAMLRSHDKQPMDRYEVHLQPEPAFLALRRHPSFTEWMAPEG